MFQDLTALDAKTSFTRREFVVTTLATGFALAVQPVSAQTITTDTNGLIAGEVKIPLRGEIPLSSMHEKGSRFGCVVVQESSACTNTSKTCAAASRSSATLR